MSESPVVTKLDYLTEAIGLVQEMVRNRCVNPPGNEMRSIRSIEKYLSTYGVSCDIMESAPDRGNLLCVVKGSEKHPSLMLGPGHVDVVPVADPSIWTHDPFSGEIHDGCIWGRGTLDMLYVVAAQVVAFAQLWREGFRPRGDLKLLVVCDEEAAGTYGAEWLVNTHPDKVKVDYLITEGGGYEIAPHRVAYNHGEKGGTWLRLSTRGREQHGSMPFGSDNAVLKMAEAVRRLACYRTPVSTDHIRDLVQDLPMSWLSKRIVTSRRLLDFAIRSISRTDPARASLLYSISRMTISPNLCKGGTKVNVVPGEAYVDVDIRTLPGQDQEYVAEHLKRALGQAAKYVTIGPVPREAGATPSYGNSSDKRSPLVEIMEQVAAECRSDDTKLVPMLMPGVTDCRFFRQRWNTQAYGFSLFDSSIPVGELMRMAHGTDERISLGSIDMSTRAYMEIARRFLA
ncbi:MAG: M20/M25/M40 family metallo-hydrolase [Candidatus Thorarchaeota archaeon]